MVTSGVGVQHWGGGLREGRKGKNTAQCTASCERLGQRKGKEEDSQEMMMASVLSKKDRQYKCETVNGGNRWWSLIAVMKRKISNLPK